MSTSPVSYCWVIAATSPFASRLSRAAIAGSSDDGRTALWVTPASSRLVAFLAGASLGRAGGTQSYGAEGWSSPPGHRNGAWVCVVPEARRLALRGIRPGGCGEARPRVVPAIYLSSRSYEAAAVRQAGEGVPSRGELCPRRAYGVVRPPGRDRAERAHAVRGL